MFVLCPHCQFLVGVDPRTGRPPAACPKCGKAMESQAEAEAEVAPVESVPVEAAPIQPAPMQPAPIATEPTPQPAASPAPATPSADDFIAAMAQKAPRKPRAKTKEIIAKPAAEKPARRKRATHEDAAEATPTTAPAPKAAPKPTPAPKPAGPSLSARIAAWAKSLKPAPKAKPAAAPEPPPAEAPERKKATVKPVPSLRERAAKHAAAATPVAMPDPDATVEAPTPVAVPTEVATLAPTPVEAALAAQPDSIVAAQPEPIVAANVETVVEPAVIEALFADAQPTSPTPPTTPPPPPKVTPPLVRRGAPAPSFARARSGLRAAMPARWQSIVAIGGLALLLAVQLLLAQRDALAADARWRPTIGALCGMLRCSVPAWREPDAFTMLSRDVRPHPVAAGTLQIDASFRNDARWSQAWPRLVVSLSDIDGRVLGTRAFTAKEYLGDAAGTQPTLAPGQTAAVSLAVVEPAPGVVAFSFEFR